MFLSGARHWYTKSGEQRASGSFLILMNRAGAERIKVNDRLIYKTRGIVRHVKMWQSSHFMVGETTVSIEKVWLSGTYGCDGSFRDVGDVAFAEGFDLPFELYDAWSKGEGWNGAGSEGPAMREWAESIRRKRKNRTLVDHEMALVNHGMTTATGPVL